MQAVFYTVTKRVNSTALPTGGTTKNIKLKQPTSLSNPVISLKDNNNLKYNYCYIPDFDRYYWIIDAVVENKDIVSYSLSVDVLASYRSEIMNSTKYINRSASNYNNNLTDTLLVHGEKVNVDYKSVDINNYKPVNGTTLGGCFLMTVMSNQYAGLPDENPEVAKPTYGYNSVTYVVTFEQLHRICAEVFSPTLYNATDLGIEQATICNPFQYLISVRWVPMDVDDIADGTAPTTFGWMNLNRLYGALPCILDNPFTQSINFEIKIHNQSVDNKFNWIKNSNEWSSYLLMAPGIEPITIDASLPGDYLYLVYSLDKSSGSGSYLLFNNTSSGQGTSGKLIATGVANLGVNIPVNALLVDYAKAEYDLAMNSAQSESNDASFRSAIIDKITNFFSSAVSAYENSSIGQTVNFLGDVGSSFFEGVVMGKQKEQQDLTVDYNRLTAKNSAIFPTPHALGTWDSNIVNMIAIRKAYLIEKYYLPDNDPQENFGLPCHKNLRIGSLSGYCECGNGYVSCDATEIEKSKIANMLVGGFYVE